MICISCYSLFSLPFFLLRKVGKNFEVTVKFCVFVRLEVEACDTEESAAGKCSWDSEETDGTSVIWGEILSISSSLFNVNVELVFITPF